MIKNRSWHYVFTVIKDSSIVVADLVSQKPTKAESRYNQEGYEQEIILHLLRGQNPAEKITLPKTREILHIKPIGVSFVAFSLSVPSLKTSIVAFKQTIIATDSYPIGIQLLS